MDDDGRTRRKLIVEIDELRKRLVMLEASQEAELVRELETAREEGAHLQRLIAGGTDVICELDADGTLLYVSANAETILGLPAEKLVGRSVVDTPLLRGLHPDDHDALAGFLRDGMGG